MTQAKELLSKISPRPWILFQDEHCTEIISKLMKEKDRLERIEKRYNYLRGRDLDTISNGGVFAGQTPENLILSGDELDEAIDESIISDKEWWMNY